MGFSVTAAGIIVTTVLLLSLLTSVVLIMKAFTETVKGIQVVGKVEREKLRSTMIIRKAVLDTTDNRTLYFWFSNNGTLEYYDFESFDLIVTYKELATGLIKTVRLEYNSSWWIINVTINGGYTIDFSSKKSVEPSESAVVKAVLPSTVLSSHPIKIVFVNQYGSRAIYKFVGAG